MQNSKRKYIYIKVKNGAGVVNRISSLFRKRSYNMEGFSVDFLDDGFASVTISIKASVEYLEQVISQVSKLYDIIEVYEVTDTDKLYYIFFVSGNLDLLKEKPLKLLQVGSESKGVFFRNLDEHEQFKETLESNGLHYKEELVNLII